MKYLENNSLEDYINIRQHYRNIKSIEIGQLSSFLLKSKYVYLNQIFILREDL